MNPDPFAALTTWLPPDAVKIVLVLFLSFMVGLEREEHRAEAGHYAFGGVRTYPLIGLIGYAVALLSGKQLMPVVVGFGVVAGFLWLSYQHKLAQTEAAGVTTEMSGLTTYLIGALAYHQYYWVAVTLGVASVLLLEMKSVLEDLSKRIPPQETLNFTKFLLLSAVILPLLPNQGLGPFQINPFKTWLVVVAVSGVSYGSYVLQKASRRKGGILLAALLSGAYSSTVATVVLAKRAARENRPHLFSGATLMASGVMYLRLVVLVGIFSHALVARLAAPFLILSALAVFIGWLWSRRGDPVAGTVERESEPGNPLELNSALLFAVIFLAVMVVTRLVLRSMGHAGVYALAAVMGVTDVDPFVMSLTQSVGRLTSVDTAAVAILIAAASNNVVKGIYAFTLSDRKTGVMSLTALLGLAAAGVAPIAWLAFH